MDVKLYENQGSADNLLSRKSGGKGGKTTLSDLEGQYKMATISKSGMSPAPQRKGLDLGSPKRNQGFMARTTSNDDFARRIGSPNVKK